MLDELNQLLALRQDAQALLERLRNEPRHALATHIASMLVLALAEHIADAAGQPPAGARRH